MGFISVADIVYLYSFSRCCLPNLRNNANSEKIRTYSISRSTKVIDLGANLPVEGAYATSYKSLIVTLDVFRTVFEILTKQLFYPPRRAQGGG